MDYSNLTKFINNRYKKVNRQHIFTKFDERRDYKGPYANQGFLIMLQANKKYNENKSRTEVWNTMYDYVD